MAPRKVLYVLSTHWDREWYQAFQHYRWRLVHLVDSVLDGLEDGRLKGPFQTDGQAIILEDYLEVRPERRPQVERFAREGKLVIGPWYVLPDEFLVAGESHIRNIRLGRQLARDFGGTPSQAGFACDLFGHISQLPQIFGGFGIDNAFIWRGINLSDTRHLLWKGADGTELITYKYDLIGYCDYAFKVRDAEKHEVFFDHDQQMEKLNKYLDFEASKTAIDPILLFDGGDHQEWQEDVYEVFVERMKKKDSKYQIQHTSLDEYVDLMRAERGKIKPRREGELREPGLWPGKSAHQIHGVLSSRVWIKQQNAHCETLLTRWAEPFTAFARKALDHEDTGGFLHVAWRYLLRNHPHDSICGCSIDQVHEDMKYRFSQSRQIAEAVTEDASQKIAASIQGELADDEVRVVVFNPAQENFEGTTELDLHIPENYPKFGEFFFFEDKPAFKIFGPDGKEIPYQRVRQTMNQNTWRIWVAKFPQNVKVHIVRVSLPISIPAVGYTALTIKPGVDREPYRHPVEPGLATSERSMENEFIAVRIESNGSLTITDKRTGEIYADVLTIEDASDIGDGWFRGLPVNEQVYVSSASSADVAMIENGKYVTAFRIRTRMNVPREFNFATMRRSEERTEMIVDSIIRLRPGIDCLEVETTIDNKAADHRVRVLMPSGAQAKTYLSDTPFDVVERDIALLPNNHEHFELDVDTKPQQNWTAVFDKKRGLSVISTGLYESAVIDVPQRTMALTLFRSTRRTVGTNGEPGGQLFGEMHFKYYIRPLKGAPDRTEQYVIAQRLSGGLHHVHIRKPDLRIHSKGTKLPARAGMFQVTGGAVMTSARQTDAGFEIRLFNPTAKAITARIEWPASGKALPKFKKAQIVDFESQPLKGAPKVDATGVAVNLKAKQIVTVALG